MTLDAKLIAIEMLFSRGVILTVMRTPRERLKNVGVLF